MESAVSNVGAGFTDDQVNELTLRHFENLQVRLLQSVALVLLPSAVSCLSVRLQYVAIFLIDFYHFIAGCD